MTPSAFCSKVLVDFRRSRHVTKNQLVFSLSNEFGDIILLIQYHKECLAREKNLPGLCGLNHEDVLATQFLTQTLF